jgi:predicted hydrocarbon binding protein
MNDSRPAPGNETPGPEPAQEPDDGFRPDLPLAVLESVRQHDRPTEVLEDEDLAASLPRRLGLTGVVESQIHRYRLARKRRERIPSEDVSDLLRLVLRRPDSEAILREAGHELARHHRRELLYRMANAARLLPESVSTRIAKRALHRLMRRISGGAHVRVTGDPLRVEASGLVTARADRYGVACVIYASAIEETIHHATGRRPTISHVTCEARGEEVCAWETVDG